MGVRITLRFGFRVADFAKSDTGARNPRAQECVGLGDWCFHIGAATVVDHLFVAPDEKFNVLLRVLEDERRVVVRVWVAIIFHFVLEVGSLELLKCLLFRLAFFLLNVPVPEIGFHD